MRCGFVSFCFLFGKFARSIFKNLPDHKAVCVGIPVGIEEKNALPLKFIT